MDLNFFQVLILTIWAGLAQLDGLSFGLGMNGIIETGVFTGLIVGNPSLGLVVGGTFRAYALGIGTYGGASIPNWTSAAMIVTALASGPQEAEALITAVGVPAATLAIQFDILGRMSNTFFQTRSDEYVEKMNLDGIRRMNWLGTIPWALSRAIPVFIALQFGGNAVLSFVDFIEANIPWLTQGFATAGRMLPAVGFTVLLKYLPLKEHFAWLIIGFVLSAYLEVPVLGVSLVGIAGAYTVYKNSMNNNQVVEIESGAMESGDEYDED